MSVRPKIKDCFCKSVVFSRISNRFDSLTQRSHSAVVILCESYFFVGNVSDLC